VAGELLFDPSRARVRRSNPRVQRVGFQRVQKDAKSSLEQVSEVSREQPRYGRYTKDRALKILIDYKESSGRKWQKICTEIIQLSGAPATLSAPILTRQDLESWEKRKSVLGDEKFQWVFKFLTHPQSLARPEFSSAADLLEFGGIERVGSVFADYFSDHKNSTFIRRSVDTRPMSQEVVDERVNGFQGCFFGSDDKGEHCLSLKRHGTKDVFIAHYLVWPATKSGEPQDWDIERWSGFCTIGNAMRLHTKGVVIPRARDLLLLPKYTDYEVARTDNLLLITDGILSKSFEIINFANFSAAQRQLSYVDPKLYTIDLTRHDDVELGRFIEQFQWNIPL